MVEATFYIGNPVVIYVLSYILEKTSNVKIIGCVVKIQDSWTHLYV